VNNGDGDFVAEVDALKAQNAALVAMIKDVATTMKLAADEFLGYSADDALNHYADKLIARAAEITGEVK
jgi:hypothetical protein